MIHPRFWHEGTWRVRAGRSTFWHRRLRAVLRYGYRAWRRSL